MSGERNSPSRGGDPRWWGSLPPRRRSLLERMSERSFRLPWRGDSLIPLVVPLGWPLGRAITPAARPVHGAATLPDALGGPGLDEGAQVPSDGRLPERAPASTQAREHLLRAEGTRRGLQDLENGPPVLGGELLPGRA